MKEGVIVFCKQRILLSLIAVCFFSYSLSEQFVYPVTDIDDDYFFVLYQKSVDDIELWLCNKKTSTAISQALNFMSLPSQIKILPDKSGFSFVDKGRIRIKKFSKRTSKVIDIAEPIDSIMSMSWIDDEKFYFSGKYGRTFGIFVCNAVQGAEISTLMHDDKHDYVYPNKICDLLFCIQKDRLQEHVIVKVDFLSENKEVIFKSEYPICFLNMQNASEGFFLEYRQNDSDVLDFSCNKITLLDNGWRVEHLFDFSLPIEYLIGSSDKRVYESMVPFLPNYSEGESIYFVDTNEWKNFEIKSYNKEQGIVNLKRCGKRDFTYGGVFAPCVIDNALCCGFIVNEEIFRNAYGLGLCESRTLIDYVLRGWR